MAARENTPVELWEKILKGPIAEIKIAAAHYRQQRDLQFAIKIETEVLQHLQQPVDEMIDTGAAGFPGAGASGMSGMPPVGGGGAPGGMPNPDELRRALP